MQSEHVYKNHLFINRSNTNKNAENLVYKQPKIHV